MDGERLKLARKRAQLSLRDLAHEMGGRVSAQAIGKYERGEMTPSSEVLIALSKALGVSIPYLLSPQGIELGEVDFRTKASTGAKDRAAVSTEVIEWVERYVQVERILELESAAWRGPGRRSVQSPAAAERAADWLREEWALGGDPIPNMTELLEEKGIKVLVTKLPEKVSGLTCMVRPKGGAEIPAVVVNAAYPLERRRLTLAHELGHRVLKAQGVDEKAFEKLCTRFAGAFLVPRAHLEQEIGKHRKALGYRELLALKRFYRVSASALLMRLEQVGVIDEGTKQYAFRTYARSWRRDEPEPLERKPQERGQFERARRFERLVYRALAEDLISTSKASELLREPVGVVEEGLRGPAGGDAGHR